VKDKKMLLDEETKLDIVREAMQRIEDALRKAVEKNNDMDLPIALAMCELINPNNKMKTEEAV
tara:strand:+ start:40 stop:228 length:189 start_codon:yes stop_codon:yes gene_type:complete